MPGWLGSISARASGRLDGSKSESRSRNRTISSDAASPPKAEAIVEPIDCESTKSIAEEGAPADDLEVATSDGEASRRRQSSEDEPSRPTSPDVGAGSAPEDAFIPRPPPVSISEPEPLIPGMPSAPTPEIRPLRLDRLPRKATPPGAAAQPGDAPGSGRGVAAAGADAAAAANAAARAAATASAVAAAASAAAAPSADGETASAAASASTSPTAAAASAEAGAPSAANGLGRGGDGVGGVDALALGAAPVSGFRSGRFTPRSATPPMMAPRGAARSEPSVATFSEAAAKTAAADADEAAADAADAAACGDLRLFVMSGPPLPQQPPSPEGRRLPQSFYDACVPAAVGGSGTACWPRGSSPPSHLRFFCFPSSLVEQLCAQLDGGDAYGFSFTFTASDGSVRWGCAVTGADPAAPRGALTALSVVLLSDWPLLRLMLEAAKRLFAAEQRRRTGWRGLREVMAPLAASLVASAPEVGFLMQHPLWLPTPLAPLLEAVRFDAEALLQLFLVALLERPLLLVTSSVSRLFPTAAALVHSLSPLSYSGTFIPFLPDALHPDAATLINHSPTPYIIGLERHALAAVGPLASHVHLLDIDAGTLTAAGTIDPAVAVRGARDGAPAAGQAAVLQRLLARLQQFTGAAASPAPQPAHKEGKEAAAAAAASGERSLQAVFLTLMRDLLAVSSGSAFRASPEPADAVRAEEFVAAHELALDVIRSTADLPSADAVARRVLMCRADSLLRICAAPRPPPTPSSAFLAAAFESRTVREFLLAPATAMPRDGASGAEAFADASWLGTSAQPEVALAEHAVALDAVQQLVEDRVSDGCPALFRGGMLSPRTARFQQRFEVGVNETLLGSFACALHFQHGLRPGELHVSTRHICFETAAFPAAHTKLPLARVQTVERCRDPLFHLIPNAVSLGLDDGTSLVLASFQDREEAHGLLARCVKSEADMTA